MNGGGLEMVMVVTLCVLGLALLLMPEVFVAIVRQCVEHPGLGGGLLAMLCLVGGWIYKR